MRSSTRRPLLSLTALFTFAAVLAACSGDEDACARDNPCGLGMVCVRGACEAADTGVPPTDAGTPRDAEIDDRGTGFDDAQVPDTGPADTGPRRDAGQPDSGRRDGGGPPRPCPNGEEGCACTSNIGPNDTAFLQDDCTSGLLCIPFDLLSGRQDLTGPVQSCVRPCATDTDCGAGQACVASGFDANTGAARICADRVADYDEFCGLSRSLTSRVPSVTLETAGEIVGCPAGLDCMIGTFSDIHPDEGICLSLCMSNMDCAAPTPYCNPEVFTQTGPNGQPQPVGVCSVGRFPQGTICGSGNPNKVGITSRCDTSPATPDNTFCISTSVTPDGYGMCMTACDSGGQFGPCTGTEPNGTPQTCSGGFFSSGIGVCQSGCTNYPDTCSGPGEQGVGRFCMTYFADDTGNPIGLCMDRRTPTLAPATFDGDANPVSMGDNCYGQGGSLGFTQCPDPGHCEIVDAQQGIGLCIFGCGPIETPASAQYCSSALNTTTGTCAQAFTNGGQPITTQGICGDTSL